jgi:hypothetical protein
MLRKPRFAQPATEELFQYWDRRRAGRPAPDRSEIEPSDIRSILPDTFILEVDEARGYAWRLAGTRVCGLHCRELKGRDFLTDWHGKERATLTSLLEAVVTESAVAVLQAAYATERGQMIEAEMVLLPLRVFARPICRVLGAIATTERPYWIGIAAPTRRTITGMRLIWPSGVPEDIVEPQPPACDPILDEADGSRRYRHLMVLDGGKR